jgi:hypothetical protein
MAAKSERKLQTVSYSGETRRWNFERYVRMHVDQHSILDGLKKHGHTGLDERSKVRHLLTGIKTKILDHVKAQILSNADLRNSFDKCVNLFQDFISQTDAYNTREVTIAAFQAKTPSTKVAGKVDTTNNDVDMTIEDRYYTRAEYDGLTPPQKRGLAFKREKRGHIPGSKSSKGKGGKSNGKRQSNEQVNPRFVKKIKAALATMGTTEESDSDDTEMENTKGKKQSNRTNKHLRRKVT